MWDHYPNGMITWTDISVPDVDAAKTFYTELMGWDAIDQYNKYVQEGLIVPDDVEQCASPENPRTCYPQTLEDLVEGVEVGDPESLETETVIFLRRIPVDPFTGEAEWGLRSYQDDWDSKSWGGENIYDVYSLSPLKALDGTYYSEW